MNTGFSFFEAKVGGLRDQLKFRAVQAWRRARDLEGTRLSRSIQCGLKDEPTYQKYLEARRLKLRLAAKAGL